MPTEKPRVTFTISQEKLSQVEEYRFDNKIKNQTQAILSLLEKGLEYYSPKDTKTPLYSSEALNLARDYDKLDEHGQRMIRVVADEELSRVKSKIDIDAEVEAYRAELKRQVEAAGKSLAFDGRNGVDKAKMA